MDAKVFRYVIALTRTKNYSRAAKDLFITPQGLSSAIKRLESSLGVTLFEAKNGQIDTTEYGRMFYHRACQLVDDYDTLIRDIDELRRKKSGAIRLAVSIGLFNVFPRKDLEAFGLSSKTGARIESTKTMLDDSCEKSLLEKSSDFALINNPVDHSVFSSIPLHTDFMFLWGRADSPLMHGDWVSKTDLSGQTISCLSSREFKTSRMIESVLSAPPCQCTILRTDEVVETLEVSMRENAYALVPRTHAHAFENMGYKGIPVKDLTWGFSVAYRTDRILTPQDEEFLEFIRSHQQFYC